MTLADLQQKYGALLESAKRLDITPLQTHEIDGRLVIRGAAPFQMEKNLFWDELKTYSGWQDEVKADITVKDPSFYGLHKVAAGDTLSKLAEQHLGDARRYMEIFNVNRDVLIDPNSIKVGLKLRLPARP